MVNLNVQNVKIGILGGGQLGRMLFQAGLDLNLDIQILDPDPLAPCSTLTNFTVGNLNDYDTVIKFGNGCDLITIEIENVNTKALRLLVDQGKKVYPQPHLIELIQNKCNQKKFFKDNNIPTADFILVDNRNDIKKHESFLPAVNKLAKEGYDGRGVHIVRSVSDIPQAFDTIGLLEKLIDFEKEISVIVARNENGQVVTYPPVEMIFHKEANLVEYLFSPAELDLKIALEADLIAKKIIETMQLVGILAVEMFVTKEGNILVNEVAPRPHNSGHQSIEANITSQYNQHLRAILNLPLGNTAIVQPSAMINILGEEGYAGSAIYKGLKEVLSIDGTFVHLYGKKITKPLRKMGHVTIMDKDIDQLKIKSKLVKEKLKVIA